MLFNRDDEDTRPDNFTNDEPDPRAAFRPAGLDADDPFAPVGDDSGRHQSARPAVRPRFRRFLWWSAAVLAVALSIACWLRYFHPYADGVQTTGFVRNIEHRGILFKTYEADLITHEALTDTTTIYQRDLSFSVTSDSLAAVIQQMQGTGRPVRITYERYYATVPWRGASKNVVTGVELK